VEEVEGDSSLKIDFPYNVGLLIRLCASYGNIKFSGDNVRFRDHRTIKVYNKPKQLIHHWFVKFYHVFFMRTRNELLSQPTIDFLSSNPFLPEDPR
jgi:hypothetical protein